MEDLAFIGQRYDDSILILDVANAQAIGGVALSGSPTRMAISDDGTCVFAMTASSGTDSLAIIDVQGASSSLLGEVLIPGAMHTTWLFPPMRGSSLCGISFQGK